MIYTVLLIIAIIYFNILHKIHQECNSNPLG